MNDVIIYFINVRLTKKGKLMKAKKKKKEKRNMTIQTATDFSITLTHITLVTFINYKIFKGGARGVMVIVAGYGHGDTSSDPGPD